jgi:hypothetical protein
MSAVRSAGTAAVAVAAVLVGLAGPASAAAPVNFGSQPVGTTGPARPVPLPLSTNVASLPAGTIVYAGGDPFLTAGLALSGITVPVSAGTLLSNFGDASLVPSVTGVMVANGAASDFILKPGNCIGAATSVCTANGRFRPRGPGSRADIATPVISNVAVNGSGWDPNLEGAIGPYFAPVVGAFDAVGLQGTGTAGPGITLSPTSGPAGTALTIKGTLFPVGETITVKYRTGLSTPSAAAVCTATVLVGGTFSCSGSIPTVAHGARGPHVVVAKSSPSGDKAKATFTLT